MGGQFQLSLISRRSIQSIMADSEEDNSENEAVILNESDGDREESIIITMNDLTGEDYDSEIRWEFDSEVEAGYEMISSMLSAAEGAKFRKMSRRFDNLTIQAYTIHYFKQQILEAIDESDIRDSNGGREVDMRSMKLNLRQEMIVFYTSASAVIEDLSIQLIIDELVPRERESKTIRQYIARKRQKERENLLYYFGVVGEGTKGEIREVVSLRNNLLHNPGRRTYLETIEDIRAEINRTIRVLDRLHSMIFGNNFSSRLGMWEGDLDFLR